jgi:hypothetical protein
MKTAYFLRIVAKDGPKGKVVDTREFESASPFAAFNVGHLFNWDRGVVLPILEVAHTVGVMSPNDERATLANWTTISVNLNDNQI